MHGSSIVCRFVIVFILSEYVLHEIYKQREWKYYFQVSRIIVMNLIHSLSPPSRSLNFLSVKKNKYINK